MTSRHIVVREAPGRAAEVVHTDAELEKWLRTHPDGQIVYDAAQVCCIFCRTEETVYMLANNHGDSMGYARGDGVCIAMYLRRNHVKFMASPERGTSDQAREQLAEYLERAAEVWRDMSWAADAYARLEHLQRLAKPAEHHQVPDSEQESLL